MQLTVTGKQVDVGGALRRHVEESLDALLGKYFRTAIEAHAVFAREAHLIRTDLSLHVGRGIMIKSGATASDYYPAFDAAAERLAKQLRRYKRRLRDHHARLRNQAENSETARAFVLAPVDEEAESEMMPNGDAAAPVVIAEMSTELPRLTVGEAVMRMDLADAPVLLFRNRSHGELNVVYRRSDGNVGWLDPALEAGRGRNSNAARDNR
ncbi:MAG: ribosome-associated translation inhibitor RaiA [Chloroflexi bacterium]|nr:MAG: ribosome-associated translation inhibitor RaiA [Chloroflexota bacterium]